MKKDYLEEQKNLTPVLWNNVLIFIISCIDLTLKNNWIFRCVGYIFTSIYYRSHNSYIIPKDLVICSTYCNEFGGQHWKTFVAKSK